MVPDARTLYTKLHNAYCIARITWQFGKAFERNTLAPLPLNIPKSSPEQVETVASLISKSRNPLLLVGSQATLPPVRITDLQHIVNELGIPCYLGGMARGLLGKQSKLQMCQDRRGTSVIV